MTKIKIYTDGACSGNPGKGGCSAIIEDNLNTVIFSKGYRLTTNNRMELMACIIALESLETLQTPRQVTLYSDSKYVVDSMTNGWVKNWKANNWKQSNKKPAKNVDLWKRMLSLTEFHDVEFSWVKGHSDNKMNKHCDDLAVQARQQETLLIDENYENSN